MNYGDHEDDPITKVVTDHRSVLKKNSPALRRVSRPNNNDNSKEVMPSQSANRYEGLYIEDVEPSVSDK